MGTKVKTYRSTTRTGAALLALLGALSSAGCAVGPDYQRPDVAIAPEFRGQSGVQDAHSFADLAWWEVFRDEELQALIVEALNNNNDLDVAVARIDAARGLVGVARSQGLPQMDYEGLVGEEAAFVPLEDSAEAVEFSGASAVLRAAWEVDLWGRIRRSTEATQANLFAAEYARRGVMLSLVSDVAASYYRLLRLDRELAIAQESAGVYRDTLDLFTVRFELGRDSRLPVERARAAYDSSNARVADLRREIAQQENALCVLLGAYPRPIARGAPLAEQAMPQTPTGLTSDLLRRRPDILRAEQVMIGANAEVGVAVANYFPRVGLSALAGQQSVDFAGGVEGDFGVWNILGAVTGPLFSGGRLEGIYSARRAFWDESIAQYRQSVLVAFQETSDALVAQQRLAERRAAQETQVQALRRSVEFALLRYRAGRSSYFEVLEAEQQLFPAEDALAQTQQAQLGAVVSLYKALGGGWTLRTEEWAQPG
jgi:multidrug efflux system outer membrane protein